MKRLLDTLRAVLCKDCTPQPDRVPDAHDPVLVHDIIRDEGYETTLYFDSKNIPSIGVGWNLLARPMPRWIIDHMMNKHISDAIKDVKVVYPDFDGLAVPRQRVLIGMSFNLGREGLRKFEKMWVAIRRGDWHEASEQIMDSQVARSKAKRRWERYSKQMLEG